MRGLETLTDAMTEDSLEALKLEALKQPTTGESESQASSVEFSTVLQEQALQQKQQGALSECDRLITHFSRKAAQNKYWFRQLKYLSIFLTAFVTILSAVSTVKKAEQWQWVVPVVSGLATLSTTLLGQTNSQKVWVHSRSVQQQLQVERFLYLQGAGDYANLETDEARMRHFSHRIMEIWSSGHENWQQNVSSAGQ